MNLSTLHDPVVVTDHRLVATILSRFLIAKLIEVEIKPKMFTTGSSAREVIVNCNVKLLHAGLPTR